MARIHSKDSVVMLNATALTAYTTDVSFERAADTHDTTCLGDAAHTYMAGLTDGSCSLSGIYDSAATVTPQAVIRPLIGGASVTLVWRPAGTGAGLPQDSVSVIVESYTESAPVADMVKWEASLKLAGPVTTTAQ